MTTGVAVLDTDQYVRVNAGRNTVILDCHRDAVRVVFNDAQPSRNNEAYHDLTGADAPLIPPFTDTDIWVLATTENTRLVVTEITAGEGGLPVTISIDQPPVTVDVEAASLTPVADAIVTEGDETQVLLTALTTALNAFATQNNTDVVGVGSVVAQEGNQTQAILINLLSELDTFATDNGAGITALSTAITSASSQNTASVGTVDASVQAVLTTLNAFATQNDEDLTNVQALLTPLIRTVASTDSVVTANTTIPAGFVHGSISVLTGQASINGALYEDGETLDLPPMSHGTTTIVYPEYTVTGVTGSVRINYHV